MEEKTHNFIEKSRIISSNTLETCGVLRYNIGIYSLYFIRTEHTTKIMKKQAYTFREGLRDGVPIGLGYLSVSFGLGIAAVAAGLSPLIALIISMTNETSAGQKAGLDLIADCLPLAEGILTMILSQFIINLRYSLMGISLSQRLDGSFTTPWRMLLSFHITDEIFAVAAAEDEVDPKFFAGLSVIPYVGWTLGTLTGALVGNILPQRLMNALCIALYGMFVAIVVPPAKKEREIFITVVLAMILSCLFAWVPGLNQISPGLAIIASTILAATVCAIVFPVKEEDTE